MRTSLAMAFAATGLAALLGGTGALAQDAGQATVPSQDGTQDQNTEDQGEPQ
jgi:hypothetical protein